MFENESAAVRLGIEYLRALTAKDFLLDPSFDPVDLEQKLNEIQSDVNRLISNLPVEAIDDDEEREQECPGDFEDSEELEDEVVECERLVALATELLAAVREHYLPSSSIQPESTPASSKPIQTKKKDIDWTFLWIIIFLVLLVAGAILS